MTIVCVTIFLSQRRRNLKPHIHTRHITGAEDSVVVVVVLLLSCRTKRERRKRSKRTRRRKASSLLVIAESTPGMRPAAVQHMTAASLFTLVSVGSGGWRTWWKGENGRGGREGRRQTWVVERMGEAVGRRCHYPRRTGMYCTHL